MPTPPFLSQQQRTSRLPAIQCPRCRKEIAGVQFDGKASAASSYASCLRRCDVCGLGFSNGRNPKGVAIIYRDPFESIPAEIVVGLEEAFATSLSEVSRAKKRDRLASSNSEDHATWVVFRHLQLTGQLRAALVRAGVGFAHAAPDEPTMLLWGSPVPAASDSGRGIRQKLERIADSLNEASRQRSEPDVILDFGAAGVVFVEVKLRSENDDTPANYANWSKYISSTDAFSSGADASASRHYELARNWRLAWALAEGRPMALVNLGRDELFTGFANRLRLDQFAAALNRNLHRQFIEATWTTCLGKLDAQPEWLRRYLDERCVLVSEFNGFI